MGPQRRGTNLRIMIRLALIMLDRDPNEIDTRRMTIKDMQDLHHRLHAEYKQRAK